METEARLASVRQSLASMSIHGPHPTITLTNVEPAKASGTWANKISREWISSIPKPQLPGTSVSGAQGISVPTGE